VSGQVKELTELERKTRPRETDIVLKRSTRTNEQRRIRQNTRTGRSGHHSGQQKQANLWGGRGALRSLDFLLSRSARSCTNRDGAIKVDGWGDSRGGEQW